MKQAKKRIPKFRLSKTEVEANQRLTNMFMDYYYTFKEKRDELNTITKID